MPEASTHPYRVIVRDLSGGPERTHRFAALHQAESFYAALRADAEASGRAITLTLMIKDQCICVY